MKKYNFQKGRTGEMAAKNFLTAKGYVFIESNYQNDLGEIDLIMADHDWLVFVEVKYKSDESAGTPEEMVSKAKISRVLRVSMVYLLEHKEVTRLYHKYRIDAVCITGNVIHHYKNIYA